MKKLKKYFLYIIPLTFLLIGIITLSDYGISWDEPIHFTRGQAYFRYITTGEVNYDNLKGTKSYFQSDVQNGSYFLVDDGGHPPINDILSAFTNYIFYQKLHVLGDIESHHLFNLLTSTSLILLIGIFANKAYGPITAIFSQLFLAAYPLFFAESRFNIKDPPQTFFYALSIYLIWKALNTKNTKLVLAAAVASGFALGIKFNILFLPIIIFPYLFFRYRDKLAKNLKQLARSNKRWVIAFLIFPFISFFILFAFWPHLWQDPIANLISVFKYYQEIGTGTDYQTAYLVFGRFNLFPVYWILITTPPVILIFTIIGIFFALKNRIKEKTAILWLLWFLMPIARVTIPGASVYGGVRQIMEFLPGMALVAGIGAGKVFDKARRPTKIAIFAMATGLLMVPLIKFHPNQNVYFNSLVGGLPGAKDKNIPYWGNSFGNAYYQAVKWINEKAEKGAKIALIQGTMPNIPKIQLREDIDFSNLNWSGIFRKGEYLVELTHNDPIRLYPYGWEYIEKFLIPVHEVSVDGVALATVWKNDLENTHEELQKKEKKAILKPRNIDGSLMVDIGKEEVVTRFFIGYQEHLGCSETKASVFLSKDGESWVQEKDTVPIQQVTNEEPIENTAPFFVAGKSARYIKIVPHGNNSCLLNSGNIHVWTLE